MEEQLCAAADRWRTFSARHYTMSNGLAKGNVTKQVMSLAGAGATTTLVGPGGNCPVMASRVML